MIGKVLNGRYEIIEKIGEGGMSSVYKAKCHLLNRDVAVKVLKKEFANDENIVGKFKGEAAAAAGLCGNNIVNIYDVGSENELNYIVMELVEGKTLKKVIQDSGVIPEKKAIDIATQIAKALQSAHGKRIIHRDIKPQNIILNNSGGVKVADFGIAKAIDQSTITHTTKVMGTAHYFSPEQAKGGFVDFRSDIYSLGIVLYEMVTGKVPHDSDSIVSVAIKHLQEDAIPPRSMNKEVSDGMNQIILKCLEKDPNNRYSTAQDLLLELNNLKQNKMIITKNKNADMQHTKVMDSTAVEKQIKELNKKKKEKENSQKKSGKDGEKTKKFVVGVSAAMIVVLLGSVGVTWGVSYFKNKPGKVNVVTEEKKIVPFLVGQQVKEVEYKIKESELEYSILREAKSDYPKGTIIECKPVAGTKVEAGTVISFVISRGPEGIKVSDYRGMNISTVKGMITSDGLSLGTIQENSSIMEEGKIISQSPESGSEVKKNSKISFVISSGPEISLTPVPEVTGLVIEEGKKMLTESGMVIGELNPIETRDKTKQDVIFSQSISAGTEVKEASVVSLSYYEFKEDERAKLIVPNFVGMYGIDAEQKAYNTGMKVEIQGKDFAEVIEQSVEPGTKVYVGEKIILKTKKDEEE